MPTVSVEWADDVQATLVNLLQMLADQHVVNAAVLARLEKLERELPRTADALAVNDAELSVRLKKLERGGEPATGLLLLATASEAVRVFREFTSQEMYGEHMMEGMERKDWDELNDSISKLSAAIKLCEDT